MLSQCAIVHVVSGEWYITCSSCYFRLWSCDVRITNSNKGHNLDVVMIKMSKATKINFAHTRTKAQYFAFYITFVIQMNTAEWCTISVRSLKLSNDKPVSWPLHLTCGESCCWICVRMSGKLLIPCRHCPTCSDDYLYSLICWMAHTMMKIVEFVNHLNYRAMIREHKEL